MLGVIVQTIRPGSQPSRPISIDLIYDPTAKAFNFINHGTENIYLWGDKLDAGPKSIDKPRVITPTGSYHIFADKVADEIVQKLGPNGESRVPFEVYVSTEDKKKHVISYELWIKTKDGSMTIETQNLGTSEKEF